MATAGSSFDGSNFSPGTMPIAFSFSSTGASDAGGGFDFINAAIRLKNVSELIAFSWSTGAVFMSTFGSTTPSGAVYGLPKDDSGTSL